VAVVLKELEPERLLVQEQLGKALLAALVLRQPTVVAVAAVLAALELLVQVGFVMALSFALGLVMVDWASKAQSTALQRLTAAAVELE
jgi:hypothetical protein